jgi:hypothetical protein
MGAEAAAREKTGGSGSASGDLQQVSAAHVVPFVVL